MIDGRVGFAEKVNKLNKYYLGIDISKAKFNVCLNQSGKQWAGEFENNNRGFKKLKKWLENHEVEQLHACMEATGRYGEALTKWLYEQGHEVSVVNPQVIHHYAKTQMRRNKNDQLDARLIARYVEKESPKLWEPTPVELEVLRALTRRLASLQESLTAETNRLKAGSHPQPVQESIDETMAFLKAQIAKVKAQIQDHIDQYPELRQQQELLASIKGIGTHTAAVILGELPPVTHFETANQVTAYAGLTPEQLQSGQTNRQKGLIKMGSKHLRTALFLPALSAMIHNPILVNLAERLRERGKQKMTIVGAVMRKLLHLVYGVLKNQQPFDPYYLVNVRNTA